MVVATADGVMRSDLFGLFREALLLRLRGRSPESSIAFLLQQGVPFQLIRNWYLSAARRNTPDQLYGTRNLDLTLLRGKLEFEQCRETSAGPGRV